MKTIYHETGIACCVSNSTFSRPVAAPNNRSANPGSPKMMTATNRWLVMLTILLLTGLQTSFAQLVGSSAVAGNFGVESDLYARSFQFPAINAPLNQPPAPNAAAIAASDDWFEDPNVGVAGTGVGVIDTTGVTATPPISAAAFRAIVEGGASVVDRNRTYETRMSYAFGQPVNGYIMLDAVAARDNNSISNALDSTVFTATQDKNGDNTKSWVVGVGGTPQKNDLVDVGGHIRLDPSTAIPAIGFPGDLWGYAFATTMSADGTSHTDFEVFRAPLAYSPDSGFSNFGPDSGHTAGKHLPPGTPVTPFSGPGSTAAPGDMLVSVDFLNGGTQPAVSIRVWVNPLDLYLPSQGNAASIAAGFAQFNALSHAPFIFTGVFTQGSGAGDPGPFGYAEIAPKNPLAEPAFYGRVNTSADTKGTPWGSLEGPQATFENDILTLQNSEIGINFSKLGLDIPINSGNACVNLLGTLLIKTRSSGSFTAELKDFAGPFQFGNFTTIQVTAQGDAICPGGTANLTSSAVSTTGGTIDYAWTGPGGFTANTQNTTATALGQYIVCASVNQGCIDCDTVQVTALPGPTCNITGNNEICLGESTSFTATGGGTYSWTGPGGFTANTASTGTISTAGVYTVTITAANGCTSSCARTLTVNQLPVCNITGNNEICLGGSTSFTATGGTSYSWTGPGGFTANTANTSAISAAGVYTVVVTDANSCSSSCSRTLTVNQLPVCNITGNNVICLGGSTSFTATGGTSYSWTGPGGFTANTANTGAISAAGVYTVVVTDANSCSSSCSRTLTVNQLPVCNITGNNVICLGGSTSFTATGGTSYSWTGPGGFTANTANTGAISAAGVYTVVVTDANSCSSSCSRTLTVNQLPVCNITGNNEICLGGSTSFTATGGTSYSWTGPGGFTANTASTGTISAAGVYTVVVTDANSCSSSCSRTLTVNQLPVCNITGINEICIGGSTSFTATGGTSYSWTGPGGFTANTANTGAISAAGVYTVVVTDANSCSSSCSRTLTVNQLPVCNITGNNVICLGGSTSFTATGGTSFSWTGPGGFTANTANTGAISAAGVYTVVVSQATGCSSSCSRTLTVNQLPVCNITGNNVICLGGSTSFTATGGTSYSWTGPGGFTANTANTGAISVAGVYTVVVTDANSCSSSCSRTLTVNQLPVCNITGNNVICLGGSTSFTATGGTSYSWTGPGGFTANTANTGAISAAGVYTVVVTDANSCSSSCSRTLTVNQLPVCNITGNNSICVGSTTSFTATGGTSYSWTGPGGFTANTANTGAISVAGVYTVVVTDANTCSSSCSRTLTINPQPNCSLAVPANLPVCGSSNTLSSTSNLATGYAWSVTSINGDWLITGGQTSSTVTYTAGSGIGYFKLIVTSADGCVDSCEVMFPCVADQFCTMTQGYFGNAGGAYCNGPTTVPLITSLLSVPWGDLTIGGAARSITFSNTDVQCILDKMPASKSPDALPVGHKTCATATGNSYLFKGKFNSVIWGQTLTLALGIRLPDNGALANLPLTGSYLTTLATSECGANGVPVGGTGQTFYIPESVITHLGANNTVADLLALANDALNGQYSKTTVPTIAEINQAVDAINRGFDECRFLDGFSSTPPTTVKIDVPQFEMNEENFVLLNAYPNPFNSKSVVEFTTVEDSPVKIEVFNTSGVRIGILFEGNVSEGDLNYVEFDGTNLPSGVYMIRLTTGDRSFNNKMILIK